MSAEIKPNQRNPQDRMGCLGAIIMFPKLTAEAFREIRVEQRAHREVKRDAEAFRAKYESLMMATQTRNEGLQVLSQANREILDGIVSEIDERHLPLGRKLLIMERFERESAEAFEKFRITGSERDQEEGEMFLRAANEIRKQVKPQESSDV